MIMRKMKILVAMLWWAIAAMAGQPAEFTTADATVSVEFFTPTIVHVVKAPLGHSYAKKSLVVTATAQDVASIARATPCGAEG